MTQDFFTTIKSAKNILIMSSKPDGDSIGAAVGLLKILRKLNKQVRAITVYPIPNYLEFLNDGEDKVDVVDIEREELNTYDLVIILDTTDLARCINGKSILFKPLTKFICIDHHQSKNPKGMDIVITDPNGESTCGIIVDLCIDYKIDNEIELLDAEIAFYLYAGIVSDTDYFGYSNVSKDTFERAAYLMAFEFDASEIMLIFRETLSMEAFRFIQRHLPKVEINSAKKYAYLKIVKSELLPEENLQVVNEATNYMNRALLRIITGIDFCFVLKEINEHKTSVALRLHNNGNTLDLSKIASKFGGGGHKQAAGIVTDKNVLKFELEFIDYLDKVLI